jgi:hypothetical protein
MFLKCAEIQFNFLIDQDLPGHGFAPKELSPSQLSLKVFPLMARRHTQSNVDRQTIYMVRSDPQKTGEQREQQRGDAQLLLQISAILLSIHVLLADRMVRPY